jgi:2-polyprenyl-3-methyl-5-hydroxy-6-metoxy-1,4-benzoquinol methylase
MDTVSNPPAVVNETLDFLGLTNRRFGGEAAVLSFFKAWSRRWKAGETLRVLDVGTGGADIPRALARWTRGRRFRLQITAVDLRPEIVQAARERCRDYPEIAVRQGDAFALREEPFDYVTASLFLHHMPPENLSGVLKGLDRLALRGMVLSDLLRSRAGYWSVFLLSRLAGNFVVRHDGPLSVRRAFRPEELDDLARGAGLPYLKARRRPWFRLVLAGEKSPIGHGL